LARGTEHAADLHLIAYNWKTQYVLFSLNFISQMQLEKRLLSSESKQKRATEVTSAIKTIC